MKIKVGLAGNSFLGWGGGLDFLKNYINALRDDSDIELILMVSKPNVFHRVKSFLSPIKHSLMKSNKPNPSLSLSFKQKIKIFTDDFPLLKILFYERPREKLIEACLKENIDIIFPCGDLGSEFPIKWIGYVYDFQHKYYSEFFTSRERAIRDQYFSGILSEGKAVIVNAEAVKNDCEKFYPGHKAKVYVTPFAPVPRQEWLNTESVNLSAYNLPEKFFVICNQFWKHKDHITAFKALSLLRSSSQEFKDIHIVCTGQVADYRWPTLKADINKILTELGITEHVHFLGYIPKLEQIAVLKKSIAVIQPTLLEGGPGGGVAFDSISLGKRIILSDIPVNQEIKSKLATFFKTKDPEDLMLKMSIILSQPEEPITVQELIEAGEKNRQALKLVLKNMLMEQIREGGD